MSVRFQQSDVVILRRGLPEHGIRPRTRATIVKAYPGTEAYVVEVEDWHTGETVWTGTVQADALEPEPFHGSEGANLSSLLGVPGLTVLPFIGLLLLGGVAFALVARLAFGVADVLADLVSGR